MKKIIIGVSLCLLSYASFAANGTGFHPVSSSFINNGTYVLLTNNTTYANAGYGTNLWYFNYAYGTNILSGATNGYGNPNPPTFIDAPIWVNGNGDASPNITITATVNVYSNFPPPFGYSPVVANTIWTNPVAQIPFDVDNSNTVTMVFSPITDSSLTTGFADGTNSFKTFTLIANAVGNLPFTVSSNVPTAFLVGASKIRLVSATASSVSGSTSVIIDNLKATGWSP